MHNPRRGIVWHRTVGELDAAKEHQSTAQYYDAALKKCGVPIETASSGSGFHPDAMYGGLTVFESLREAWERSMSRPVSERWKLRASPGSLLDDIVEEIDSGAATTARPAMRPTDDLQRFVREAVRPYLTARRNHRALTKKLFVGNLPYEADENQLHEWFKRNGFPTRSVTIAIDRLSGQPRGFGFVELTDKQAVRCILSCNGQDFLGRTLIINESGAVHEGWPSSDLDPLSKILHGA